MNEQTPTQVLAELIRNHWDEIDPRQSFILDKELRRLRYKTANPKVYPDFNAMIYLYGCILEKHIQDGTTIKENLVEAIEETINEHGKNQSWWDDVKNTKVSRKNLKKVVDHFTDHPDQISLLEDRLTTKRDLYAFETVNQQMRNLVKVKQQQDRISKSEKEIELLKQRVSQLEKATEGFDSKEWVLSLYKSGTKPMDISTATGISKTTVYRWINEFRDNDKRSIDTDHT